MLIYCDSVILSYFFDRADAFQARAANRMTALQAAGDFLAVSDLTRLECRVGPMKRGDTAALIVFDQFFARPDVRRASLGTAAYDRATVIRATYGFKTADALHLAAAVEARCDRFLTNDNRLSKYSAIPVEILT